MHITLVISSLWGGGAERVASILANGWTEQGRDVSILTFEHGEGQGYAIHPSVRVRRLGLFRRSRSLFQGLSENVKRIRVLRQAIRESEPDIILSFMDRTNVLTILATRSLGMPVIISERTSPRCKSLGWVWSGLRKFTYPLADTLVCPTRAGLIGFQAMTKIRGTTIPNPVAVPPDPRREPYGQAPGHILIAMGRLVPEKGFDLLLQAFAQVAYLHPKWSLTIIGKGPLQSNLEEQSKRLELAGRVHFAGELADPFPVLRAADLFVFSSRFEGFGMALAEAMACGLPVVSFDCPEGPRDIIRDGVDGILVPAGNVDALAVSLDRLMSDAKERGRLAARAPEVTTRFSRERILSLWQEIFNELLSKKEVSR